MTVSSSNAQVAVWDRVLCGIDGSAASVEGARQVARLMPASSRLTLCEVVNPAAVEGGTLIEKALSAPRVAISTTISTTPKPSAPPSEILTFRVNGAADRANLIRAL